MSQSQGPRNGVEASPTWTLAVQREVMLVILDPETPGGLRLSMDCRYASSSATADDMVGRGSALPLLFEMVVRQESTALWMK